MKKQAKKNSPTKFFNGGTKNTIPVPKDKTNIKQVASFMANLIKYNRSLFKKELEDWEQARAMALSTDNPRRYFITQINRDISLDMFFKGMINQRIGRITNKKVKIVNANGEKDDAKTKLFERKKWFKEFRKFAIEAKFCGYRLPYLFINEKGKLCCKAVWPENVVPEQHLVLQNPFDTDGYDYTQPPLSNVCIGIGDPEDLGLFESLAMGYILKKHSWQSWDEFEERFSIPMIIAKTASEDAAVQNEILDWLSDLGAGGNALFPMDTEIDYKESKHVDAFQVFNEKRKALNEEAAILINGQQESSNNTGSRAKTEALIKNTTDQITEDDKSDVEAVVNDDLLPMLRQHFGFALDEGDTFEWDDADMLPIPEMAKVLEAVDKMGFELDAKDVSEKLGVKILGKKKPIVEPKEVDDEDDDEIEKGKNHNKKPTAKSKKPQPENSFESILNMHKLINELLVDEHTHG